MNPFRFYKYIPFLLRKKFKDKYIIIESDDWGLERGITEESIEWLKEKYGEGKFSRWSTDALETKEDLNELFNLLENYKNKFEFPPVITANFITHNIDYGAGEKLSFIPLSKGFNEGSEDVRALYKEGIENKYIFPQLHGYSHFNLDELEKYFTTDEGKEAFDKKFFAARSTIKGNLSFLHGELSLKNSGAHKIKDASEEMYKVFGFRSATVIPPTFVFDIELAKILKESSITMVQSSNRLKSSESKHYSFPFFQKRKGLYWSVRNARLDPYPGYDFFHEQCLKSIENAFENQIPAVIDFHRVNFSGKFAPEYRQRTLKELNLLFSDLHERFPEVKFIHSQKLNDMLWRQEIK